MVRITVDPLTRTTSGLRFEVDMKDGAVVDARCAGTSYRGFEKMLTGRDPMDAVYFTQRVCGMCSAPQATAAVMAIENLCGATGSVPKDALVIRNILNGLTWIRSHVENLYLSFLPDLNDDFYVGMLRPTDTGMALLKELSGRFNAPGYGSTTWTAPGSAYADAVQCIKLISDTEAIFAGRSPHGPAIVPGGVTARPTASDMSRLKANYKAIMAFLERRFTSPLTPDQWLDLTHGKVSNPDFTPDPNYILDYGHTLPARDLSAAKGWNDMMLFTMFGSQMMSEMLSLSAYIELDTIGGYPLMDTHIGYLNAGAFYKVRDDNMNFRDGYLPSSDVNKAGSYHIAPGYTAGGMSNLFAPADALDPAQISEQVSSSFYSYTGANASLQPADGETSPLAGKNDIKYDGQKYSFVKAPRYGSVPCEVGPMARMINTREPFIFNIMRMLHDSNTGFLGGGNYSMTSVYTRILSRMQETLVVARLLGQWINNDLELHSDPGRYCVPVALTASRTGASAIEAPRGMLGHWVRLDGGSRIANYQIVSPTSWNASPRDGDAKYGPMELASIGIKTTPRGNLPGSDAKPLSLYHIVRSFDPCMSCAVHTIRYGGLSLRPEGSSRPEGRPPSGVSDE